MTDDSLGTHRLLAAGEKMTEARLLWERWDQLDMREIKAVTITGVFNERIRKGMIGKLRECEVAKRRPQDMLRNYSDEWLEAVANSLHIVDREMGLSAVGSMVFSIHNALPEWTLYNPDIVIDNFASPGEFGYTTGVPGAGKTNFTCYQIQRQLATGRCVITNIRIGKLTPAEGFWFTRKFTAVLRAILEIHRTGKTWVLFLDETGLYWLKAQAQRGTNIAMDKFLRILRKLGGSLIAIEQREEGISSTLQDFATQHFRCAKPPGIVNLDLKGPVHTHNIWVREFPKTELDWDTNAPAYLDMDVDIDELFEVVSRDDSWGELEKFLDKKG